MRKLLLLISLFTILSCNSTKEVVVYENYEIEMTLENGQTITETYSLPKGVSIYTHSKRNHKWLVYKSNDVNGGYPIILRNRIVSYKIL
tara:strand:- start:2595 stop:2861 length:267 start_codon:yes stop_codon:yes gene_type:complete